MRSAAAPSSSPTTTLARPSTAPPASARGNAQPLHQNHLHGVAAGAGPALLAEQPRPAGPVHRPDDRPGHPDQFDLPRLHRLHRRRDRRHLQRHPAELRADPHCLRQRDRHRSGRESELVDRRIARLPRPGHLAGRRSGQQPGLELRHPFLHLGGAQPVMAAGPKPKRTRATRQQGETETMSKSQKLLLSTLVVGVLGSAVVLGVFGLFSATTQNSGNEISAGTVALSDNDAGSAQFNITGAKPGDSWTRCIRVLYTGSLPADLKLYELGGGGPLSPYLTLKLEQGTQPENNLPQLRRLHPRCHQRHRHPVPGPRVRQHRQQLRDRRLGGAVRTGGVEPRRLGGVQVDPDAQRGSARPRPGQHHRCLHDRGGGS